MFTEQFLGGKGSQFKYMRSAYRYTAIPYPVSYMKGERRMAITYWKSHNEQLTEVVKEGFSLYTSPLPPPVQNKKYWCVLKKKPTVKYQKTVHCVEQPESYSNFGILEEGHL